MVFLVFIKTEMFVLHIVYLKLDQNPNIMLENKQILP